MKEYNKALASAGDLTKIVVLGALLILRRSLTLHKLKPILDRILCMKYGVRTEYFTEIHRVDTSTEEPVIAYRNEDECLRRIKQKHDYSPEYHASEEAESYDIKVVGGLTTLVATRSITSGLYEKPIESSHDYLIVRVPESITNCTISKTLAGVEVQLGAYGVPRLDNNKTNANAEGVL